MNTLIFDTDIGTDVDDALALGVLLGSPEIDLVGVTTVYGDTLLRARLASRLIHLADPTSRIPIVIGESETLSGRPVWWAGHEGRLFNDLDTEQVVEDVSAVDFLLQAADRHAGELEILAVGPLTNVAQALRKDPTFVDRVKHVYVMGGDFTPQGRVAEHNFLCDAVAAQEVFNSQLTITVGGLDVTTQIRLSNEHVRQIADTGALGAALGHEIEQWWQFHGKPWNNPHDPIMAMSLLEPHLFKSRQLDVHIDAGANAEHEGYSFESIRTSRRTSVITALESKVVAESMISRICSA